MFFRSPVAVSEISKWSFIGWLSAAALPFILAVVMGYQLYSCIYWQLEYLYFLLLGIVVILGILYAAKLAFNKKIEVYSEGISVSTVYIGDYAQSYRWDDITAWYEEETKNKSGKVTQKSMNLETSDGSKICFGSSAFKNYESLCAGIKPNLPSKRIEKNNYTTLKIIGLLLIPILFPLILLLIFSPENSVAQERTETTVTISGHIHKTTSGKSHRYSGIAFKTEEFPDFEFYAKELYVSQTEANLLTDLPANSKVRIKLDKHHYEAKLLKKIEPDWWTKHYKYYSIKLEDVGFYLEIPGQ